MKPKSVPIRIDPDLNTAASAVTAVRNEKSHDDLAAKDQAAFRARWEERIKAMSADLRLDEIFADEGRPYAELDAEGKVVRREPSAR